MNKVTNTSNHAFQPNRPKADKGSIRFNRIRNYILVAGLSVFAQLYLFQPLLPSLSSEFGISPSTSSLSVSMSTIGMAIGLLFFAFKADAIQRKTLMGLAMIASAIFTTLVAFSPNFISLILLSLLKGLALSGVPAVALAYLNEEVNKAVIGLSISLYLSGNTIGGMSGRVIATLIAGWADWRWATAVMGVLCLVAALIFIRRFPSSRHFEAKPVVLKEKLKHMRYFLSSPIFISMFFIAALAMGIFVSIYNYLSFLLEGDPFNIPHYYIAGIFGMYSVGILGSVLTGKWSDKFSSFKILQWTTVLLLIGLFIMQWINLTAIIIGLCIITFSFFSIHTMASRIVSLSAKEAKSSATSLYLLFYYIGSSISGWFTGMIFYHYGWHYFVLCLIVMGLAALLLSYWAQRKHKSAIQ